MKILKSVMLKNIEEISVNVMKHTKNKFKKFISR
jgi:hypothetical protein